MAEVVDLLMPKLGLTMTEGTVARWLTAPGVRFAAGDAIVVIETDKIANEVEAPSAGELVTLLFSEGEIVPVGTPIARWRLDSGEPAAHPPPASARHTNATAAPPPAARRTDAPMPLTGSAVRIIATPYARRLARESSLDLATIPASGPRGRIKGADVLRALEARPFARGATPAATPLERAPLQLARPAAPSFIAVNVDVSALRALDARLAGSPGRPFERHAYLALACIKALASNGATPVRLGFQASQGLSTLEGTARDTLSAIAARIAHVQPGCSGGDIAIFIAEGRARLLVPTVPQGWRLALGVGGVHAVRHGELEHEMTLALVHDETLQYKFAVDLLDHIAALLEEPLHLLAV